MKKTLAKKIILLFSLLLLCCNNDRQAKQIEEQIEQVENPIPEPIPETPDFPYEEIFESLKAMHRAGLESWDNMEFMAKIRAADEEGRRKLDDINMRDVYSFKDDHLQRLESYLIISYNATNKVLDSIEAKVMRNGRRNIRRW